MLVHFLKKEGEREMREKSRISATVRERGEQYCSRNPSQARVRED